jgi:hypothetical protein
MLVEILSTLSAGLFTGAAVYINLVEHNARMDCGTDIGVTEFGASYRRGAIFMGILLVVGVISAAAASLINQSAWWLIGGSFLLLPIPYTLLAVLPINKKLLDSSLNKDPHLARSLLVRWGRLHMVRSLLGLISFLIFIVILIREAPAK